MPFAPGGSGDITSRLIGKYIEDKTGQPFVVENKPGANGIVGVLAVKAAPPDGYTLMLRHHLDQRRQHPHVQESGLRPGEGLPRWWASSARAAPSWWCRPTARYKTLNDLLAYAKANPGKLNFGYFNASSQVPAEVLGKRAGVDWQAVAYKAIGNAWTDLYAGAIQFMFVDLTAGRGQVVANKARAAGTHPAAAQPALSRPAGARARAFPISRRTGFLAVAVPKATPLPVQEKLNALINEAITSPRSTTG